MYKDDYLKYLASAVFLLILSFGFIYNNSFSQLSKLTDYLHEEKVRLIQESEAEAEEEEEEEERVSDSDYEEIEVEKTGLEKLESEFTDNLIYKNNYIELSGWMAKNMGLRDYYSDIGMYVTHDDYIVSCYDQTSTDYEYEQVADFYQFLKENNIHFLYVNQPIKYIDDKVTEDEFGKLSYSNRNADKLVSRLREADIPVLDLRDTIRAEGLNSFEMFYRTDHHWTTKTGLWAAQKTAEAMNEYCGYQIDTDIYDISHYTVKKWENCWLGEQGRKMSKSYIGLDDFYEIRPDFPTLYRFFNVDGSQEIGTFDDFIDDSIYNTKKDVYRNRSWHYSYKKRNCLNGKVKKGKVLLLVDSYSHAMEPFLSLGIRSVSIRDLRYVKSYFDLRKNILARKYDTVVICYSQIMIGAHDDPDSVNYPMFSLGEKETDS